MKWMPRNPVMAAVGFVLLFLVRSASAQITSGSVSGSVSDASGSVIPGATVSLVSATKGTSQEAVTSPRGDFVFSNVPADLYSLKVTMDGFKALERQNVLVHAGDRVTVGTLAIEVGTLAETITVSGQAPMIQATSGERSYAIAADTVQNIPINGRSINGLSALAPGVVAGSVNGTRTNQNNFQIDGVGAMDTGNNGTMITVNQEVIAEVKVLTSNYQAEYGRSAGAQISAVTKSGGTEFHGSVYTDRRNDDLNANSWINRRDGVAKPKVNQKDYGYTVGGPMGKPRSGSKIFFFAAQEFQPRTSAGGISRVRVPTELERQGDFSQTRDNNGNLFNLIRDGSTGLPCTAADTRGCFQDGGVLGKIPQNRLYDVGVNILKLYPLPNAPEGYAQSPSYNWTNIAPQSEAPRRQDTMKIDWQASSSLRVTGKVLQTAGHNFTPGTIPGIIDVINDKPGNRTISFTADATLNSTTVFEATWGMSRNQLGTLPANPQQLTKAALGLANFPLLYPNAPFIPENSYAAERFAFDSGYIDSKGGIQLPPWFDWGSRVANAPPRYNVGQGTLGANNPWTNINRTNDFVASVTRLIGSHTSKLGFYLNHSRKGQTANGNPDARVNFGNDANNPLDAGFGYANAILGIYSTYQQSSKYSFMNFVYNNAEWYLQDNWKASRNLTLDYGLRFYWIQPQHDSNGLEANFLPDKWDPAQAPRLYYPALVNGIRVAQDRVTGQTLAATYIGRLVPNSGNMTNGVFPAGKGIERNGYKNRGVQYAPRFGFAYDLTAEQRFVIRGGSGVFYDRPFGDSVYNLVLNPPVTIQSTLNYGRLQDLATATPLDSPPALNAFAYEGKIPTTIPWTIGTQMALPWSSALDVSYVGSYGYNQLQQRNINAPDYGAAFKAENQDPTLPASGTAGATALAVDFLRPYRGFGDILYIEPTAYSKYHSLQTSFNRRYRNNLSFGVNYTLGKAMGTASVDNATVGAVGAPRNDANQKRANYMPLNIDRRHTLVANFVWGLPKVGLGSLGNAALNGWQLSGIFRAGSGAPYTVGYSIPGITAKNLTGAEGLESARIVINGTPGSGCSGDPYRQFNTGAFTTPQPGSIGLESGLNYLRGCADHTLDLSLSRIIRVGNGRRLELRIDAFNALNTTIFNARNNTLNVASLTNPTATNLAEDSNGNLIPANIRGFGAVTGVAAARTVQLLARFQF